MKGLILSLFFIGASAFAEKEVRTCMFDNDGEYFANSKMTCMEVGATDNITMKSLYKDGWELKTSYFPKIVGGTNYGSTSVEVVLVFERNKKK